jgi:accessory gene regulator protein AgrB
LISSSLLSILPSISTAILVGLLVEIISILPLEELELKGIYLELDKEDFSLAILSIAQ